MTRHAFLSLYERRFDEAAPMLDLAASLAHRGAPGLSTRHWVSVVQAETFAGLGDSAPASAHSTMPKASAHSLEPSTMVGCYLG